MRWPQFILPRISPMNADWNGEGHIQKVPPSELADPENEGSI
jgi:hypothetical protein